MSEQRSETSTVRPPARDSPARRSTPPTESLRPAPSGLDVGAVNDRYTVLECVGTGGMGEVYAAYDAKLDRKVALKVLRRHDAEFEARLTREAQAMARLSHPNVVAVFDTGVMGDRPYLAMEFVRGETLRTWQKSAERPTKEVLDVYMLAGHGLAAAHAAGLVHRDFKPDNVLITADGGVKVTDFGIARAQGDANVTAALETEREVRPPLPRSGLAADDESPPFSSATIPTSGALDSPMTQEGALLGTPGYMAPEQLLCESVDERTDQFSFCVSLYEALYRVKPFGDERTFERTAQATLEGKIGDPPKGTKVPAHLRRVLLRGLSAERADRYPTMRALLDDLARDSDRRRRRIVTAVTAALALSLGAALTVRTAAARQAKLCSATENEASEAWNAEAAARVEHALLATGVPYAADTWNRTRAQLDTYMHRWADTHKQTCEATRLHGHQTESVMTLRMTCLDQRKSEVKALVQVLSTADQDVAAKALQAAMSLTPVDSCNDVAQLTALVPEPTDPAKRAELKHVREGLASIKEQVSAGRYTAARDGVGPLLKRAKAIGFAPVVAEALLLSARSNGLSGAGYDLVIADGIEAVAEADAGRNDATRAAAATMIAIWMSDSGRNDEAERWASVAEGILERIGDNPTLRAEWLRGFSAILQREGRMQAAVVRSRQAFELGKTAKVNAQALVSIQMTLGAQEAMLGNIEEAERILVDAENRVVETLGPDHPLRIGVLSIRAIAAGLADREPAAIEHGRRAIALAERVAPNSANLVELYNNLAVDLNLVGDHAGALIASEKGLERGLATFGPNASLVTYAYDNSGEALIGLRRYKDAVLRLEKAVAVHERTHTEIDQNYTWTLMRMGKATFLMGETAKAIPILERAVAAGLEVKSRQPEHEFALCQARFWLAKARWTNGERGAKVRELAQAALDSYRKLGKVTDAKEVEAWQKAHAG